MMEEYSKLIETYVILLNQITYDEVSNNLDSLENSILDYLHNKFPNMSVTKEELNNIISKLYQTKNFQLKKEVECNLGKAKFAFEDNNQNIENIISDEIGRLKKMFASVKNGTNYCYLGFVDKCTQEIINLLIRWHNTISFSKETESVRKYIRELVENNYKFIVSGIGEKLLLRIVEPLENKFLFHKEK